MIMLAAASGYMAGVFTCIGAAAIAATAIWKKLR